DRRAAGGGAHARGAAVVAGHVGRVPGRRAAGHDARRRPGTGRRRGDTGRRRRGTGRRRGDTGMILTLTPNPALDVTYEVGQVRVHGEHRVRTVRSAPGGKGVNVARVLTQLDQESLFAGLLGGTTGEQLTELLAHEANEANEADETDEAD